MSESIILDLQSESTKRSYERFVREFLDYKKDRPLSEALLLSFLTEQSSTKAATTLWTMYSLLKKYMLLECSFDLGSSVRITEFLKTLSRYHKKKKAPSFQRDDLYRYLRTAPSDGRQLICKLVLLTGFFAGLRSCELVALTWEDLIFAQEGILVNIRRSKTDQAGVGTVKLLPKLEEDLLCPVFYYSRYREIIGEPVGRLFRQFANCKFTKSPMGKNTIAGFPKEIASFLGLEFPNSYTGHSLRVTSATVLADEGANNLALKRHGRWSSDSVAEEYVRNSKHSRVETATLLAGPGATTITTTVQTKDSAPGVNIMFTNCVFNGPMVFPERSNNK
jgi:integrase